MTEIPWSAIATGVLGFLTAGLTGYVALQVKRVEHTFNSKMDAYIKLVGDAKHAEGVLQERARQDTLTASRAEGVAEGKGQLP